MGSGKGTEDKSRKACVLRLDFIRATAEVVPRSPYMPVTYTPSCSQRTSVWAVELLGPGARSVISCPTRDSLALTVHPSRKRIIPGPS